MRQNGDSTSDKSIWRAVVLETIIPCLLMIPLPTFIITVIYTVVEYNSSFTDAISERGHLLVFDAWSASSFGTKQTWLFVFLFSLWSALSIFVLPGKSYPGPPTATGHLPIYKDSGFQYNLITVLFVANALILNDDIGWQLYKQLVPLFSTLIIFGFLVTFLLYLKGKLSPSPGEYFSSGNPVFDFYWGLELYPRLGRRFDVKLWTNSRFGMMMWQVIVLVCWKAQVERSGWNWAMAASSIVQLFYIWKFYWWERGYMLSFDIIHDHAGFYLCWGCIAFLPSIMNLTSLYYVENAPDISATLFALYVTFGISMALLTYWADMQRLAARASDGKCTIWGKPARIIRAYYTDDQGSRHQSLLLTSGFWGISRHMNCVFETMVTLSWALPGVSCASVLPYANFLVMLVLVIQHSYRDDHKCREKYGSYWEEYCSMVKYRVVPYVF